VVHISHGIGRYQGLINIDLGDGASEFLHLEYADKATLYVPVAQLHLISRYTGVSADEAPLHKLGSASGRRPRRKAAEQVRDTAAELLNLYARAPRAKAMRTATARTTTKPSPPASASRRHPTSAPPSTP
jgi:transcription-repair coupling factor (superfamily II helicase)